MRRLTPRTAFAIASNIRDGDNPEYTISDFRTIMPGFSEEIIPDEQLQYFIDMAHNVVKEARWHGMWKEGIHSNGSPVRNIPPRPFIEPAIAQPEIKQKIAERLKAAAVNAIEGNTSAALSEMDKAGQYGENAIKDYIGSSNLTPNSEATIRRKGSAKPLIDIGSLRSSVTHVIEKR